MKPLQKETLALRDRYDEEPTHSDHVALLALQLFDALRTFFKLDARSRELLGSAALLHDIGWSQTATGQGHHKESARLIRTHGWKTLTRGEAALVAQIARYHRKSAPHPGHKPYAALSAPKKRLVLILGGILRVADAFDRTHTGRVKKLTARVADDGVTIAVLEGGIGEPERAMFTFKRDMLELAAGRPLRCEHDEPEKEA